MSSRRLSHTHFPGSGTNQARSPVFTDPTLQFSPSLGLSGPSASAVASLSAGLSRPMQR